MFERTRDADIGLERDDPQPERDALIERDRDDPLVVVERDVHRDNERPREPNEDVSPKDDKRDPSRTTEPGKSLEIDLTAKPSHEEFMRMIEEQERALLKNPAKAERERDIDRSQDIDDGFDL